MKKIKFISFIAILMCFYGISSALPNPASEKCVKDGGTLSIIEGSGGQSGLCTFSGGVTCDEWTYFRGECNSKKPVLTDETLTSICTMDYTPVCGEVQVQCIKAPCNPIKQTFGNKCQLGANKLATYLYDGECVSDETLACTMDYNPVCGKDGITYSNKCSAGKNEIAYNGECGKKIEFSDIENNFAKNYIKSLYNSGIVSGYEDNTFKPEQKITRVEYLKTILKAKNIDYSNSDISKIKFSDVDNTKDSWETKVIAKAIELGIISPENKDFEPNKNISRAESIKIIIKIGGFAFHEEKTNFYFEDVNGWATEYIKKAKILGLISGQNINGKLIFRPNDGINRGEVAKIIVKFMELK